MYVPRQFREERPEVLARAIREIGFGALVTPSDDGIVASHVPMLIFENEDGTWRIETHVARANGHWKLAETAKESIAIFQGPAAYISPSWYSTKAEHGRVVPTWNYIAVHAHGTLEAIDDRTWLHAHIGALTDEHERGREHPWRIDDAPSDYVDGLAHGIVGLRMTVTRREGAWKMIQHRSHGDRLGTIEGLSTDPSGEPVAAIMRDLEDERRGERG